MGNNVNSNKINIFNESGKSKLPIKRAKEIINLILKDYKILDSTINMIYCDDSFIHKINKEYLNHDYETDIITFTIDEEPFLSEMYISAETAQKNAYEYKVSLNNELLRLAAHGALHIVGLDDNTEELRKNMKSKEDYYLQKILG